MIKKTWVLAFILCIAGCNPAPLKLGTTTIECADHSQITFRTAFAETGAQQQRGLMYVKQMSDDIGMLFIFDKLQPLKFWMHNTFIPLDMLFFNADKKLIYIVENAKPHDDAPVGPNENSMYVLEINGGQAAVQHIRPGDMLEYAIDENKR